jgi:hypothetical protein
MLRPAVVFALAIGLAAQPTGVDAVLERLDAYLEKYEAELSTLIADEDFRQEEPQLPGNSRAHRRRLESEVAFLRLPGDGDWIGFRRVKRVDGKSVDDRHDTLMSLLSVSTGDNVARAKLLVAQSSEHNLGNPRTINMPGLPLELIHQRHRRRFDITLEGRDRVRGHDVAKLVFTERAAPSIVFFGGQLALLSRIHAWIEPRTGELHRARVLFASDARLRHLPRLDVEFERDAALRLLVPTRMDEVFPLQAGGLGSGRASYSNFRRFQTSARIVPPPP